MGIYHPVNEGKNAFSSFLWPTSKILCPCVTNACYVYSFVPFLPFNSTLDIPIAHILKSQVVNISFRKPSVWDDLISRQALTEKLWAVRKEPLEDVESFDPFDAWVLPVSPQLLAEAQVIGIKERAERREEEMSPDCTCLDFSLFLPAFLQL